jgi:protein involved in polysaccharide export with SLBB domain
MGAGAVDAQDRMFKHCLILSFSVSLLLGCHPPRTTGTTPPADSVPPDSEFALSPGDTFDVRVFGEPDMTGTYRVAPDGTIDFPLVGQVMVEGLLPHDLARKLEDRLRDGYLRNPHVSILIKEQTSKKIIIIGQVARPGTFSYAPNMNIVEAITVAGGFTPIAAKNSTTVTRIEQGKKVSVRVPVADISEGKAGNYFVRPGDIISVPERIF